MIKIGILIDFKRDIFLSRYVVCVLSYLNYEILQTWKRKNFNKKANGLFKENISCKFDRNILIILIKILLNRVEIKKEQKTKLYFT